jgi:type I restriction enzyme R subunit
VATYRTQLDGNEQVDFNGKAKAFARTYNFLSSILLYTNVPGVGGGRIKTGK